MYTYTHDLSDNTSNGMYTIRMNNLIIIQAIYCIPIRMSYGMSTYNTSNGIYTYNYEQSHNFHDFTNILSIYFE